MLQSSPCLPVDTNTAFVEDTQVSDIYEENYPQLVDIRKKIDPYKVMNRTGGFRIGL